jgi:hypothetical protein
MLAMMRQSRGPCKRKCDGLTLPDRTPASFCEVLIPQSTEPKGAVHVAPSSRLKMTVYLSVSCFCTLTELIEINMFSGLM